MLLIATVVSFLTLFFGLRFIVRPLRLLAERTHRIGEGDFIISHTMKGYMARQFDLSHNRAAPSLKFADHVVALFFRHGLTLLLAPLLMFTLLPFAAPLAMYLGWEFWGDLLYRFYGFFCHQLPQRSWFLFGPKLTYTLAEIQQATSTSSPSELRAFVGTPAMGWKVAWSDRMISFYTLTPILGLVYAVVRRTGRRIAPLSWFVLLLTLLPLAVDGGTHAINDVLTGGMSTDGFRDTNQWLAWITFNAFPGFYAGDQLGAFNWWARLVTGALAAWGIAFTVFPLLDQFLQQEAGFLANQPSHRRE